MSPMMPARKRIQLLFMLLIAIAAFLPPVQAQEVSGLSPMLEYEADIGIINLDWSFDSKLLAFADANEEVYVINIETGEVELQSTHDVTLVGRDVAWNKTKNYLLISSNVTRLNSRSGANERVS